MDQIHAVNAEIKALIEPCARVCVLSVRAAVEAERCLGCPALFVHEKEKGNQSCIFSLDSSRRMMCSNINSAASLCSRDPRSDFQEEAEGGGGGGGSENENERSRRRCLETFGFYPVDRGALVRLTFIALCTSLHHYLSSQNSPALVSKATKRGPVCPGRDDKR